MPVVFEVDVDPYLQARRARHMQGSISLAKFERLVDALSRADGDVDVDIQFGHGVSGKAQAQFQLGLSATLIAECQRCLGEVNYPISSDKTMMLVKDKEALAKVPEEFEPVLVEEDKLSLMSIIEDELLLSLPLMFKHDACHMAVTAKESDEEEFEVRVNPFVVLSELKSKK